MTKKFSFTFRPRTFLMDHRLCLIQFKSANIFQRNHNPNVKGSATLNTVNILPKKCTFQQTGLGSEIKTLSESSVMLLNHSVNFLLIFVCFS